MRVKICGITTTEDAVAAVDAGADAIGLNFVGGPRHIDASTAKRIVEAIPPLASVVALTSVGFDGLKEKEMQALDRCRIRELQLYGHVTTAVLDWLVDRGFRPMPVLRVRGRLFYEDPELPWLVEEALSSAAAIVLDAYDPGQAGGTGRTFCWNWVSEAREQEKLVNWPALILAGGLHPANVAEAVLTVKPYGVDVSSGVEVEGLLGRKDPERMRDFVRNARTAAEKEPL